METIAMSILPDDALARHPIHDQVRKVLTDPEAAAAAGPVARRLAWYIRSNAEGRTLRQCHRPPIGHEGAR